MLPANALLLLVLVLSSNLRYILRVRMNLAPRSKHQTSALILTALVQQKQPKPKHLRFNYSIERAFGVDPLLDTHSQPVRWIARRAAS